jgi:hypothetical protein
MFVDLSVDNNATVHKAEKIFKLDKENRKP